MTRFVAVTRTIMLVALVTTVAVGVTTPATAQPIPERGGRVFGLVGGSFGNGGSAVMTSGGAGLRLTRNLGIDFELLHVKDLDLSDGDFVIRQLLPSIFPPPEVYSEGSVTAFLTKMTVDFPVAGDRLIPFVTGGGGIGRLSEQTGIEFPDRRFPALGGIGGNILRDFGGILPRDFESAETGLALTIGGGVDIRLWRGLAVGADVRWLRLLARRDTFDFSQIASRVSYRF